MNPRTHFVYTAYDADGAVLYVGVTSKPRQRYLQHMAGNDDARGWFESYVVRWHVSGPYPKDVALRMEKERIAALQPIFNGHSKANLHGRRALIKGYVTTHPKAA